MKPSELKTKLAVLWKDTFHDSDEYISLIFDNYFDENLCEYEENGGVVTAGLLGIPYEFGNADNKIQGLYLCGLATTPQYRSRGIMTRLLSRINSKARELGFAFTFLIPADSGLRKYYYDREYVNATYRVIDNYTSVHDFDLEFEADLISQKEKVADMKRRFYASLTVIRISKENNVDESLIDGITKMIRSIELSQDGLQIIHSEKDIRNIINENRISDGSVFVIKNSQDEVTAVAFTTISQSEGCVNIHRLFSSDPASRFKVLSALKKEFPEFAVRNYVSSIEMDRKALWSRTYGSYLPEASQAPAISVSERVYSLAAHSKVYGMVRVLDLSEILKFQAHARRDLKYSILVKGHDPLFLDRYDVKEGRLSIKQLSVDSLSPSQAAYVMSKRDICEIAFRRRDTDNLITEAFGIPSINASISLLFD